MLTVLSRYSGPAGIVPGVERLIHLGNVIYHHLALQLLRLGSQLFDVIAAFIRQLLIVVVCQVSHFHARQVNGEVGSQSGILHLPLHGRDLWGAFGRGYVIDNHQITAVAVQKPPCAGQSQAHNV